MGRMVPMDNKMAPTGKIMVLMGLKNKSLSLTKCLVRDSRRIPTLKLTMV